ncbi:sensor histidine kinase [Rothia sp. P5764]|uniref:sensor histidine kinase n=1 Tax=Rothia sp. P5764 TaxID=3402654 RepID=UPI003AC53A74
MPLAPPASAASGGSRQTLLVLTTLRVSLHVMFAFLLIFGAVLALVGSVYQPRHTAIGVLTLTLGAIYLAGTVYEKRRGLPQRLRLAGFPLASGGTLPFSPAHLWLLVITGLWLALMCLDSSFTWAVFPVMFLYLHLLRPLAGVLATGALCLLAVALPLVGPAGFGLARLRAEGLTPGYLVGPTLGAMLAVVISFTYRALRQDAAHQFRLAEQLRAVQAELAQQQYRAGKIAERERLAREIHDTLAQGLSSIVLVSRAASNALASGDTALGRERLQVIEQSASTNLAEARRFIHDLASPALDSSVVGALSSLVASTQATQQAAGLDFRCSLTVDGDESAVNRLPEPIASTLVRVAQGALANVAAHSQASQAVMTLSLWPGEVALDVCDNGVGFDVRALSPVTDKAEVALAEGSTGYGLISLTARVDQVGGTLNIESSPGAGTALSVRLPVEGVLAAPASGGNYDC